MQYSSKFLKLNFRFIIFTYFCHILFKITVMYTQKPNYIHFFAHKTVIPPQNITAHTIKCIVLLRYL